MGDEMSSVLFLCLWTAGRHSMSLPPPVHCWVVLRQPLSAGNVVFKTMEIKGLQSCTHSQKFEGKAAMADFKLCSHGAHNHFSQCSYFSIFISDYWFVVSFFFFRHSFQILLWRPVIRSFIRTLHLLLQTEQGGWEGNESQLGLFVQRWFKKWDRPL